MLCAKANVVAQRSKSQTTVEGLAALSVGKRMKTGCSARGANTAHVEADGC
jgi:hypothetical protein